MKNSYGLDVDHFRRQLGRLSRDLDGLTPTDLARSCARLARSADAQVLQQPEFLPTRMRRLTASQRAASLRTLDSELELFARTWVLDGDLLRCSYCGSGQLASLGDQLFIHRSTCQVEAKAEPRPWQTMVDHLAAMPRVFV